MRYLIIIFFFLVATSVVSLGSSAKKARPKDPVLPQSEITPELEEAYQLFRYNCRACHRWNYRFAAPAWKDVLPAYALGNRAKKDSLIAYIEKPYSINPDEYPPMEAPELTNDEAILVAKYLLKLYEAQVKK